MTTVERSARLVKRGDVIKATTSLGDEVVEVVRDVQISVVLGNGQTAVLPLDQNVVVITDDTITADLVAQVEEIIDHEALQEAPGSPRQPR